MTVDKFEEKRELEKSRSRRREKIITNCQETGYSTRTGLVKDRVQSTRYFNETSSSR
jgi:hypothetical protein